LTLIRDIRQVKRPTNPYNFFHTERYRSHDMKGIALGEVAKLTSEEFKALGESGRKVSTCIFLLSTSTTLLQLWLSVRAELTICK